MVCKVFSGISFLDCMACRLGDLPAGLLGLAGGPFGLMLCDRAQIVGDPPQADPAFHPGIAMIATARQARPAFQPAAAPFDPRPPGAPAAHPALLLVRWSRRRLASRPRQHHLPYPALLRQPLVARC